MPTLLAEMTWVEAEALRERDPVVLLPIGSTEAHGPHLPLGTDVLISEELGRRAAMALESGSPPVAVAIAPSIPYTITHYASEFGGTVSVGADTARALVRDVCRDFQRQGFRKVCLVSSHLEPAHAEALRAVVRDVAMAGGAPVAFPDVLEPRWARTLSDEFKRGACHAGSYETSLAMVPRPDLVRNLLRKGLPPRDIDLAKAMKAGVTTFKQAGAPDAYFGNPAAATVEEGQDLYRRLCEMVTTVVRETWPR